MGWGEGARYKVKCEACGRRFILPDKAYPLPKHPPKTPGSAAPFMTSVVCLGSGKAGIPIEPVI